MKLPQVSFNTGLAKVAVQCSADTFVVNQSFVLRINICGKIATFAKPENVTSKPNRRHNNNQTDDYKHKMKR
jgi:hypothetical protein